MLYTDNAIVEIPYIPPLLDMFRKIGVQIKNMNWKKQGQERLLNAYFFHLSFEQYCNSIKNGYNIPHGIPKYT